MGFEPVTLLVSGRFNTCSRFFQVFVGPVFIQCVPEGTVPAAFTWHCPASVGKVETHQRSGVRHGNVVSVFLTVLHPALVPGGQCVLGDG